MKKNKLILLLPLFLISTAAPAGEAGSDLQSRITKLERAVDNRGLLNILNELQNLQQEVRELRGEVEQQAYIIEQMKKRQQNLYNDLDQRISGTSPNDGEQEIQPEEVVVPKKTAAEISAKEAEIVEGNDAPSIEISVRKKAAVESSNTGSANGSSAIQPVETYVANSEKPSQTKKNQTDQNIDPATGYPEQASQVNAGSNEEDSYSEAFTLLKQGQHEKARGQFRAFLKQYPDSQYADNAQYWLGEAYYAKRDFESAIKEYKLLLSHYPDSGKVSHAQLKIGYCYDELGQKDYARGELEDLISRYPGTSAANLAAERLSQIQ